MPILCLGVLQRPRIVILLALSCVVGLYLLVWRDPSTRQHQNSLQVSPSTWRDPSTRQHQNSLQVSPGTRETVRDCITDEIIGVIPPSMRGMALSNRFRNLSRGEGAEDRQRSFERVFKTRAWGTGTKAGEFAASGPGSSLSWAQEFMATLHLLVSKVKKHLGKSRLKVLDLPCGDMQWMSRFLQTRDDIDYTGVDIVPGIIHHHQAAYRSFPWKFRLVDILKQPLNESFDIILCRMLLQHLYNADAVNLLQQFSESGSRFLLTTTFPRRRVNSELTDSSIRFRNLNLEIPPISLKPPLCLHSEGFRPLSHQSDHVALWELPLVTVHGCYRPQPVPQRKTGHTFFSCVNWAVPPS